jgi:ribosomal protein S19E (S16A)
MPDLFAGTTFERAMPTEERRRQSGAVTRKIRLLRAHGLIHKLPHTHRYQVSQAGRRSITALLMAREADTSKLSTAA